MNIIYIPVNVHFLDRGDSAGDNGSLVVCENPRKWLKQLGRTDYHLHEAE